MGLIAMAKDTAPTMDYNEHNRTYANFIRLTKWSLGLTVALLVLMALFLL